MRIMDMTIVADPGLGRARALVAMARPSQVALIVLVWSSGVLLGVARPDTPAIRPTDLGVALVLLLAAAVAAHWANEAADAETDAGSVRTRFSGGSGALARSDMGASLPLRLSLGLAVTVAITGVIAVVVGALTVAAAFLLGAGLAGGLAYSLPPVAAMRRGWGEVLNMLLGALLLPLFGVAVVRGGIDPLDVLAFLPFAAVTLGSVMATAWPDRMADAATGKRTLQVRWRPRRLRGVYAALAAVWLCSTLLAIAVEAAPPLAAAAGLLVLPLVVLGTVRYTRTEDPWPSVVAMVGSIALMTVALAVVMV